MDHVINPHAIIQKLWLEPNAEKFRTPFAMSVSGKGRHLWEQNFGTCQRVCDVSSIGKFQKSIDADL
jgi:hypothetical protein